MRPCKVPRSMLYQMVWDSLCERMDPQTRLVRPSWLMMMRKFGVCRRRIADVVFMLKCQGRIRVVNDKDGCFYEIVNPKDGS